MVFPRATLLNWFGVVERNQEGEGQINTLQDSDITYQHPQDLRAQQPDQQQINRQQNNVTIPTVRRISQLNPSARAFNFNGRTGSNGNDNSISELFTNYTQTSIIGTAPPAVSNNNVWGHDLYRKPVDVFRIAFRNINSLSTNANSSKHLEIAQDINRHAIDIFGMSEINIAWHNTPARSSLKERFRTCFESSHYSCSHNQDALFKEPFQVGGTLTLTTGISCNRIITSGQDSRQLGRWSWVLIRGTEGITVRIITVYRPVKTAGPTSAYHQQKKQLLEWDIDECPRQQLLIDLKNEIAKWLILGDKIIVMGDFNEDVRGRAIHQFFSQFHMHEVILHQHGNNAPNTYRDGRHPIDGIFATQNIIPVKSGYSPVFWGADSDHRLIWADINLTELLGQDPPASWRPNIRRLKLEDPRIVLKYNKERAKYCLEHLLDERIIQINALLETEGMSRNTQAKFEELDH